MPSRRWNCSHALISAKEYGHRVDLVLTRKDRSVPSISLIRRRPERGRQFGSIELGYIMVNMKKNLTIDRCDRQVNKERKGKVDGAHLGRFRWLSGVLLVVATG